MLPVYKDYVTCVKLSKALCKLAIMPEGASLVILIDVCSIPWGMM